MKTVKLEATAYPTTNDGRSLYIQSNRTSNYILIRERWFTAKVLDLYHRVLRENPHGVTTEPVLFDMDEVKLLWEVYKKQQRDRKKSLFPARGI